MAPSPEAVTREVGGLRGIPRRAVGLVLVTVLALMGIFGAGLLVAAFTVAAPRPPQPIAEAAPAQFDPAHSAAPKAGAPSTPSQQPRPVGLTRSEPSRIVIPKIGVDAPVMGLGVNDDGTLQVPPLKQAQRAGWYRLGPSPGELGSSVIVGHVDSKEIGPAVFYKLGALRVGDTIKVTRKDKKVVTFVVEGVKAYPKSDFPSDLVYGATPNATLRLVTCGGQFDKKIGSYLSNVIVFAKMR